MKVPDHIATWYKIRIPFPHHPAKSARTGGGGGGVVIIENAHL